MRYFLPDWDDRIDPHFDFEFELQAPDRDRWRDDVYAHEYFDQEQCYDGILVSRSALKANGQKQASVERLGLRGHLRLPRRYELMGDCGAFGYINEAKPTYDTAEVLSFYERVGVTYGISVDHIVVPAFPEQREYRYQLTINNALDFLRLFRAGSYSFTPVGAVQGWEPSSYADAARTLTDAGFDMLAIGGLVRSRTADILSISRAVVDAVAGGARIHLLGVARDDIIPDLTALGIFSFDSASPMRTSWMSATRNYLLGDTYYTAIRVPISKPDEAGAKGKGILDRSETTTTFGDIQKLEAAALAALRGYGRRTVGVDEAIAVIRRYDLELTRKGEVAGSRDRRMEAYRRTLKDRPWTKCPCRVCREIGIEVVIFRRNDRNRRRGFHNVHNFYRYLRQRHQAGRDLPRQTSLGF